jgi:ankyrin repeat protein
MENTNDINAKDYYGNTALHHAVNKGDFDLVETLVEKGADFNVQNEEGDTPLQIAIHEECYEIAELLKKIKLNEL